jgi:hypothetical protein
MRCNNFVSGIRMSGGSDLTAEAPRVWGGFTKRSCHTSTSTMVFADPGSDSGRQRAANPGLVNLLTAVALRQVGALTAIVGQSARCVACHLRGSMGWKHVAAAILVAASRHALAADLPTRRVPAPL